MPNLDAFMAQDHATSIGNLIALKPTSIVIRRGKSTLAAQTVRLETLSSQRMVEGVGGVTHACDALALCYYGHPTVANTDIQAGDRFVASGVSYEVVLKMPAHIDNIQAWLRVRA